MRQLGFEEGELCPFMDWCPFLTLNKFTKAYNLAVMKNRGELVVDDDEDMLHISTSSASVTSSALVNECLANLFDHFSMALEVNEETKTLAAMAEAIGATPLIDDDDSSPPAIDMLLNAEETQECSNGNP